MSSGGIAMANNVPLHFVFYIAATPEKIWDTFVSPASNRIIFVGAEFRADLRVGGKMAWLGLGPDGKETTYVYGEILRYEPPKVLQYTFILGPSPTQSRVTLELLPESEATKVSVTHDEWAPDDNGYAFTLDGWPRILSRIKTLIETGKTFKPH
jgi:uncharacterized protein YndB with AHSA1/START domain